MNISKAFTKKKLACKNKKNKKYGNFCGIHKKLYILQIENDNKFYSEKFIVK